MTQIRMMFVVLALIGAILASARPADACGGPYGPFQPQTDEERVSAVISAQVTYLTQGQIDSAVQLWAAVDRAEVERRWRELPGNLRLDAIDTHVVPGMFAIGRVTLASGDRTWSELYLLRPRQGRWLIVGGTGFTPSRVIAARG